MRDVAVVGGGHNGLVAACYLARAGLDVVVLEQSDKLGGGTRTDELVAGYRFDTHSVAHNLIQATDLVGDLALEEVGLRYVEMNPFSVAVGRDGAIVRFHRSVEQTVASIAEVSPADADRYRAWMRDATPLVRLLSAGLGGSGRGAWRRAPGLALATGRALRRNGGPVGVAQLLASPYRSVLDQWLATDRVRAGGCVRGPRLGLPGGTGQCAVRALAGLLPPGGPVARARWVPGAGGRTGRAGWPDTAARPVPVHRSSASWAGATRCPASPWPTDRRWRPAAWSPPSTRRLRCSSSSTHP